MPEGREAMNSHLKAKAKAKAIGEQIFANVGWWIVLDELINKQAFKVFMVHMFLVERQTLRRL